MTQALTRKRMVSHPKVYFFDPGVSNALTSQFADTLDATTRGIRFEQFVITQLIAINAYKKLGYQFYYWRTSTGLEVDLLFVKNQTIIAALEIKSSLAGLKGSFAGLKSIKVEYPNVKTYVVGTHDKPYFYSTDIAAEPWQLFFETFENNFQA